MRDWPRICGGRPSPKKSSQTPQTLVEIQTNFMTAVRRKRIQLAEISTKLYQKDKRNRVRAFKAPTTVRATRHCIRRYLEHCGLRTHKFPYSEQPEYFDVLAKTIYEVHDGLLAIACFSSAREALLTCQSLAHYGIEANFSPIKIK